MAGKVTEKFVFGWAKYAIFQITFTRKLMQLIENNMDAEFGRLRSDHEIFEPAVAHICRLGRKNLQKT